MDRNAWAVVLAFLVYAWVGLIFYVKSPQKIHGIDDLAVRITNILTSIIWPLFAVLLIISEIYWIKTSIRLRRLLKSIGMDRKSQKRVLKNFKEKLDPTKSPVAEETSEEEGVSG